MIGELNAGASIDKRLIRRPCRKSKCIKRHFAAERSMYFTFQQVSYLYLYVQQNMRHESLKQ